MDSLQGMEKMKNKFRSFEDAKKFVQILNLKSNKEWRIFAKSKDFPADIPTSPDHIYKKSWTNWGDWLGTGRISTDKKQYRSFQNARNFIRTQKLMNNKEWRKFAKSKDFPADIPASPEKVYKNKGWNGWGDFLGTGNIAVYNRTFLSFQDAREFVRRLNLKNSDDWQLYCKSGKKPNDIPSSPKYLYKNEYLGIKDWLGTGKRIVYDDFEDAKKFVQSLKIKGNKEWRIFAKSKDFPADIPKSPDKIYKKEWEGWGDFLGTGSVATFNRKYKTFEEARTFVQSLGLKNHNEWRVYCKSSNNPSDIPKSPEKVYKKEWTSWGDFLGTGTIAPQNREYSDFEDAKKFVQSLGLKSRKEWNEYCKSSNKPDNIPTKPDMTYKNKGWKGVGDFLGTGTIAPQNREYSDFEDAKKFVQSLKIKGNKEWRIFAKSKDFPADIPKSPDKIYKKEWTSWGAFLGTGSISSSKMIWREFSESKKFIKSLKLKNVNEWYRYCKSGNKPYDIPSNPNLVYKKDWKDFGDFLGTGIVSLQVRSQQWLGYEESKKIVRTFAKKYNLKNWNDWRKFAKSGELPDNIPTNPSTVYSKKRNK